MKKILLLLLLVGCTSEPIEPVTECICEKVIYTEQKQQEEASEIWYLNRTEVERLPVDCQDETDFAPTGEVLESFRIECQ